MKKIFYLISVALLAISCQKSMNMQECTAPQGTPAAFYGEVATKTAIAAENGLYPLSWAEGDRIGIYGTGASEGSNYAYTATLDAENAAKCVFAPSEAGRLFCCGEGSQDYYAYYPYDGSAGDDPKAAKLTLPAQQEQYKAGYLTHIGNLFAMKAAPVRTEGTSATNFVFEGLYSIVQFTLKMSGSVQAPIDNVQLISESAPLAFDEATVDLTSDSPALNITSGSKSVELRFTEKFALTTIDKMIYMVVAPGTHPAGSLVLKLTATDGSTNTIALPAVTFEPNKVYAQTFTVNENDFGFDNPFDAQASSLSCNAGQSVTFTLSGIPGTIEFWSGEVPHRWEFRNAGETAWPDINMSFKTFLQAGAQPTPLKVKYSKDYNGAGTEAAILAATWTDITDRFTYATDNSVTVTPTSTDGFVSSGIVNVSDVYTADESVYFCFFYHVDAFVTALNNGRTQCYLNALTIDRVYGGETTNLFTESKESLPFINGASYDGESSSNSPSWNSNLNAIKFTSAFKPTSVKDAYAVTPAIRREGVILSADSGIVIKGQEDAMIGSYTYKFDNPGTYNVVFVGNIETFAGTKQIVKEFQITVK